MKQAIPHPSKPDFKSLDVKQRARSYQKQSNSEFTSTLKINFSNRDKKSRDSFSFRKPLYGHVMPVESPGEKISDSVLRNPVISHLVKNAKPAQNTKLSLSTLVSPKDESLIPRIVDDSSNNMETILEKRSIQISKTESRNVRNDVMSNPNDFLSNRIVQIDDYKKSHPYIFSTKLPNPKLFPNQALDSDITSNSQSSEKPDTTLLSNKRPNIYKPKLNRPTRYPIPLKSDIYGESIKFQTRKPCNKLQLIGVGSLPIQTSTVDKPVMRDRLQPTIEFPNSIPSLKPSIGFRKLHSPNSIANRTKIQSRIFVLDDMDFGQLSDVDVEIKQKHTNLDSIDSCRKVINKRSDNVSVSKASDVANLFLHNESIVKYPVDSNTLNVGSTSSFIDPQPKSLPNLKYKDSHLKTNVLSLEHKVEKYIPHILCVESQLPINFHGEPRNIPKYESSILDTCVETAIPLSKPLSLAKDDLQNWIKNTIDIKDSITAAYLISSHIFEKTYQSISQRHALERRELEINYDNKIQMLLQEQNTLRKQYNLLYFTKPTSNLRHCNNGCKIQRFISLPTNLALYESSLELETTMPTSNAESKFTTNLSQFVNVSNTSEPNKSFPSPPPDLPEVLFKIIPLPPPDLPSVPRVDVINTYDCTPDLQSTTIPKPKNRKQSIMKPLHWKRLCLPGRKNKQEVIWKILPKSKIKSSELVLFEQLFSTQKLRKPFRPVIAVNLRSALPQEILPLDISKQIGVIFKNIESLNIHLEDIAEMLYTGDIKSSHLTTSILENLCKLVTDEWINVVKSYVHKNPTSELSKESKVLQFFCDIPNVNMRFRNLLYMENFEEEIRHIHGNIDIISNCCLKLKNSYELRVLFSIILLLGNYMNQTYDSFKEAVGFNLELLPRLKETKTNDNSSTFLDFVSRCYLLTFEHSISHGSINNILPFPDTGDLFVASKITLKDLYEGLSNLGEQLTKIRENTRHFLDDSIRNNSCNFVEIVEEFFVFAEKKITHEIELWKVGERTYKELIYYFYGETKDVWAQTDALNFFGLWCNFASSFKESLLKEHKNIVIKRRNDFNKSGTRIIPISSGGLKQKVKFHAENKVRFSHSLQSVNIH